MYTLNVNDAKTNFGEMLLKVQSEPVEIKKNGTSVAVFLSTDEYKRIEALKIELVKSRFKNVEESELAYATAFFDSLDSETNE